MQKILEDTVRPKKVHKLKPLTEVDRKKVSKAFDNERETEVLFRGDQIDAILKFWI